MLSFGFSVLAVKLVCLPEKFQMNVSVFYYILSGKYVFNNSHIIGNKYFLYESYTHTIGLNAVKTRI